MGKQKRRLHSTMRRKIGDEIPRHRGNRMEMSAGGFEDARCREERQA